MNTSYYNETEPKRRIKELEKVIQRHYDDKNWYGYNHAREVLTIAAQTEYALLTGKEFKPTYTPAQ